MANEEIGVNNAMNPVAVPTAGSNMDLVNLYHIPPKGDATILPIGHYKSKLKVECDATIDAGQVGSFSITREVLEFMKVANKMAKDGKMPYGHIVSYQEAGKLLAERKQNKTAAVVVQPRSAYVETQPVVGQITQLSSNVLPPIPIPMEVKPRVDVTFSGPFGKLKVQYDEVFVQDIYLVLVQRVGSGMAYDPPDTGEASMTIQVQDKQYTCFSGPRFSWPDGSMSIAIFLLG